MAEIFDTAPPRKAKKKNTLNGFAIYMREQRVLMPNIRSMQQLVEICHPRYQEMTEWDRQRYEDIAKKEKARMKDSLEGKLDCTGKPIRENEAEARMQETKEEGMLRSISAFVGRHKHSTTLAQSKIYMMHVNVFNDVPEEPTIPAELALIEYSIIEGITKVYHCFINPGELPYGSGANCKLVSELSHKIPFLEADFKTEDNYIGIFNRIKNFVNPTTNFEEAAFIYVPHDRVRMTEKVLDWIKERACTYGETQANYKVFDLVQLMVEIHNYVNLDKPTTICEMNDKITCSMFDYTANICCDWHEEQDVLKYCSLGVVRRYAYILSDLFCNMFGVTKIPMRHLPQAEQCNSIQYQARGALYNRPRPIDATYNMFAPSVNKDYIPDSTFNSKPTNVPPTKQSKIFQVDDDNSSHYSDSTFQSLKTSNRQMSGATVVSDDDDDTYSVASGTSTFTDDKAFSSVSKYGSSVTTSAYSREPVRQPPPRDVKPAPVPFVRTQQAPSYGRGTTQYSQVESDMGRLSMNNDRWDHSGFAEQNPNYQPPRRPVAEPSRPSGLQAQPDPVQQQTYAPIGRGGGRGFFREKEPPREVEELKAMRAPACDSSSAAGGFQRNGFRGGEKGPGEFKMPKKLPQCFKS